MAQALSRWPLTAESGVRARVNPCGICGGQSGTGTGLSTSSPVFPCQYHSAVVLHTHVSYGGWTICPVVAAVQRRNLTPSIKSKNLRPVAALLIARCAEAFIWDCCFTGSAANWSERKYLVQTCDASTTGRELGALHCADDLYCKRSDLSTCVL
jgi:hypothetical protein